MNWAKLFYVLIIVLLYIPMVFLGANVFFPEYTGSQSYYQGFSDCYMKYPYPEPAKLSEPQRVAVSEAQRKCQDENTLAQRVWEQRKLQYEGMKYVWISLFNLGVVLLAVFLPKLQESVSMGLFLAAVGATFGGTIRYFDTQSKAGFLILVTTFFLMLFFINQKKDSFVVLKRKK